MDAPTVLSIKGLQTYFHTYEGTVKAVEGIDLEIREGETVGLVGETGCGKSVTALSVLRLIPSPPGKIEGGRAFLNEPDEVRGIREEYDAQALERLAKQGVKRITSSAQVREVHRAEIENLEKRLAAASAEEDKISVRTRLAAARSDYDILAKTEDEMRTIRGNSISMIFQEPMTAMNPVFTVGAQIAETLIIHRRQALLKGALEAIDLQLTAREKHRRGHRLQVSAELARLLAGRKRADLSEEETLIYQDLKSRRPGEEMCSICRAPASVIWDWCPSCGTRLTVDLLSPIRPGLTRIERRLYTRMINNPNDQLVDFLGSVRILRRLVRNRLQDEGVRLAVERLREVKIPEPERIAGQYPFELSGGMRQRSMIAMMMACSPKLLIADEPTTALDVTVEAQILKLMKELQTRTKMSILLITHDLGIVAEVCDQVGVMYAGSIAEFGTTEQVFHRMMHPYTNGLMQSIPRFKGAASQARKKDLYIIHGSVPNLLHPPSGCRFHPRCPRALDLCKEAQPALEEAEPGHFVACHNPVPLGEAPA